MGTETAVAIPNDDFSNKYTTHGEREIPNRGSIPAVERGCPCTAEVHREDCPVHRWICGKIDRCEHQRHDTDHYWCEHCTVPVIVCTGCSLRYADWSRTEIEAGWEVAVGGEGNGDEISTYRCPTCKGSTAVPSTVIGSIAR